MTLARTGSSSRTQSLSEVEISQASSAGSARGWQSRGARAGRSGRARLKGKAKLAAAGRVAAA